MSKFKSKNLINQLNFEVINSNSRQKNKLIFLANLNEIKEALESGFTIKTIYSIFKKDYGIDCHYNTFRKYCFEEIKSNAAYNAENKNESTSPKVARSKPKGGFTVSVTPDNSLLD